MQVETLYREANKLPDNKKEELQRAVDLLLEDGKNMAEVTTAVREYIDKNLCHTVSESLVENSEKKGFSLFSDTKWFMFSPLLQMTLPHKDTKTNTYVRTNGIVELTWMSKDNVPFGRYARLLMLYLCSIAVKYNTQKIELGASKAQLAKTLRIPKSGKAYRALQEQVMRLRSAVITQEKRKNIESKSKKEAAKKALTFKNLRIFDSGELWWDEDYNNSGASLLLSDEFYAVLKERAVPLDFETILELQGSSYDLDLYAFISHRMNKKNRAHIPWSELMAQLGNNCSSVDHFKEKIKMSIPRVLPKLDGIKMECTTATLNITKSKSLQNKN